MVPQVKWQEKQMSLYLRGWVGLVSVVSTGNAVMCFIKKDYPRQRIYDQQHSEGT